MENIMSIKLIQMTYLPTYFTRSELILMQYLWATSESIFLQIKKFNDMEISEHKKRIQPKIKLLLSEVGER